MHCILPTALLMLKDMGWVRFGLVMLWLGFFLAQCLEVNTKLHLPQSQSVQIRAGCWSESRAQSTQKKAGLISLRKE